MWIYHHHERMDGKGYPEGLQGTDIPFVSRMIAIADTYSALTTDRPYRKGKSHDEAISIMKSVSGAQLDKFLLQIFVQIDPIEIKKQSLN
jgi:HD-GYP domain-containing protein (c-di-GMP phosphodiesterase class II)